ncbi:hypothetical protein EXU30_14565 [Shewanella maritima]|uniref:Uncharacterized protein n=1 Tax=Shewanella maritima TaxID=2520507 RepID=A0A411PJV5_9GAMM|nr:hypothetical protein [Shewanella maritima]QBF83778.1 hypothetical protein EXU30_14565 [Shewanella maritima]
MLNGFLKPTIALVALPYCLLSFSSHANDSCDVKVTGSVPQEYPVENMLLRAYNKDIPITQREFSVCLSKQDLAVPGKFTSNNRVSLSYKQGAIPKGIYSAGVFVQTTEVELNPLSSMAVNACDSHCNYYLYQQVLASEDLAIAAEKYPKERAKIRKDDWDAIVKLNTKQAEALTAIVNKTASVQSIDVEKNPVDSPGPYSGSSYKLIDKDDYQIRLFLNEFSTSVKRAAIDKKQLKAFGKANKQAFDKLTKTGKRNWQEQTAIINELIAKLQSDGSEVATKVAKAIEHSRDKADKQYQDYLANDNHTPFPRLNSAKQPFELVLANWTMSAYLSFDNEQTFPALFSEKFKQEATSSDKRSIDKPLSQLMYMPASFALMDITKGYENIQRGYKGLLPDSETKYHFSDALHSVTFVYEKGAWRLDQVSQIPLNHYEL